MNLNDNETVVNVDNIQYEEPVIKTGEAAERLGIARDMVRHWVDKYYEFFPADTRPFPPGIKKVKNGKRTNYLFTSRDIDILAKFLQLRGATGENGESIDTKAAYSIIRDMIYPGLKEKNSGSVTELDLINRQKGLLKDFTMSVDEKLSLLKEDIVSEMRSLNEESSAKNEEIERLRAELDKARQALIENEQKANDLKEYYSAPFFTRLFKKKPE